MKNQKEKTKYPLDERILIKLWRICKKEYKVILSFALGCIAMYFILS